MRNRIIATTLMLCALGQGAWAQELSGTLKKIKDSGTLTIGRSENSVPFSYVDPAGNPIGGFCCKRQGSCDGVERWRADLMELV